MVASYSMFIANPLPFSVVVDKKILCLLSLSWSLIKFHYINDNRLDNKEIILSVNFVNFSRIFHKWYGNILYKSVKTLLTHKKHQKYIWTVHKFRNVRMCRYLWNYHSESKHQRFPSVSKLPWHLCKPGFLSTLILSSCSSKMLHGVI